VKNKATERQTTYNNKVKELNKTRKENERKTAEEIELIDAELFALKTKGTDQEIYATLNLYAIKKKQIEEAGKREIELTNAVGKEKERIEKETQLKLQQLKDATFNKSIDQAKKETELTKQEKKDLAINIINSATQLADSLMQISRNQIQQEMNEEKDKFDAKQKARGL